MIEVHAHPILVVYYERIQNSEAIEKSKSGSLKENDFSHTYKQSEREVGRERERDYLLEW